MSARKARRAWGLAERTTQPTTTCARWPILGEAAERDGYARHAPSSGPTWRQGRDLEWMVIRQRLLGHGTGVVDERSRSRAPAERGVLASVSRVAPAGWRERISHSLCGRLGGEFHVPRGPWAIVRAATGGSPRAGGSSNS